MALDLEATRTFVKIAELASFTRAAEQLGIPKAKASLQIRALEAELGVRLLQRTTRTVHLTADGAQFLPRARQLVQDADELGALFQTDRALRGTVRVDLPISFAREHVIPRLPELLAAHPHLELQLSTTDRRTELLKEGIDVVMRVGTLPPSSLTALRLGEMPMVNCASPAYLRKYGTPTTLADLDQHYLVHYSLSFGGTPTFEYLDGDRYREHPMQSFVSVNNTDAYRAACLAGLGIVQAPRIGVRDELEAGRLVEILRDLPSEPMHVSLVHGHGRTVPKRVRAVMTWLASVAKPRLA